MMAASRKKSYICVIEGALGQLQPHPQIFFKKVEIFVSLEVYTYVVTAC